MDEHPCNLNDIMRAIGTLEGKVEGVLTTLSKHGDKLDSLQNYQNQQVGKTTMIGAAAGVLFGLIGSLIQGGFFHK